MLLNFYHMKISIKSEYLLPWNRVLLEKLIGSQLVKKFPEFYETQRFNNAFTSAHRLSLF